MKNVFLIPVLAASLVLGGCAKDQLQVNNNEEVAQMGVATAVASPPAIDPEGTLIELPRPVTGLTNVGEVLAVQVGGQLRVGTVEQVRTNASTQLPLPETCGEVTAASNTFVVACPTGEAQATIYLIEPTSPNLDTTRTAEIAATNAVVTSDDVVVASSDEDTVIETISPDGAKHTSVDFKATSSALAVITRPNQPDVVVTMNQDQTKITEVIYAKPTIGASLRAGLGVADMAAGEGGFLLATDTYGEQLLVYNDFDVIRLHQQEKIVATPWAVGWDAAHQLAWVSSLSTNQLVGYSLATGTPVQAQSHRTIADAQFLTVLPNGTLVVGSASGAGLEVIEQ